MIHATPIPYALPARSRLALLAIMAAAMLVAMVGGCVNARVHDVAVKLQAQLEALHETSEPIAGATPEQVELWSRAWAQAKTQTAQLVEVSR